LALLADRIHRLRPRGARAIRGRRSARSRRQRAGRASRHVRRVRRVRRVRARSLARVEDGDDRAELVVARELTTPRGRAAERA
jgi:hypothetical protein